MKHNDRLYMDNHVAFLKITSREEWLKTYSVQRMRHQRIQRREKKEEEERKPSADITLGPSVTHEPQMMRNFNRDFDLNESLRSLNHSHFQGKVQHYSALDTV